MLLLFPFDMSLFCEHFFSSWHHKMFLTNLVLSLSNLWNQLLSQGTLYIYIYFFGEKNLEAKICGFGVLIATDVSHQADLGDRRYR